MVEVTYRDFRRCMRIFSKRAELWTEMINANCILYCERSKLPEFLGFGDEEHPIVCQLGGAEPPQLAEASQVVEQWGYDGVNLNCGCPSDRVAGKGCFGAALMKSPEIVRDCIHAMSRAVQIPVSVKCRLGVDNLDSPEFSKEFVATAAQGGCKRFIVHARKAWLNGLSPAQNRSIPPLMYDRVVRLCNEFPDCDFTLNGGILDVKEAKMQLYAANAPSNLHGVMIGRGALANPCMLVEADALYGDELPTLTRRQALDEYCSWLDERHEEGAGGTHSIHQACKPVYGIFHGLRNGRRWRNVLDQMSKEKKVQAQGPAEVLRKALEFLEPEMDYLDEPIAKTLSGSVPCAPQQTRASDTCDSASWIWTCWRRDASAAA
jgi:tRNA-dihydrouridine synthase A